MAIATNVFATAGGNGASFSNPSATEPVICWDSTNKTLKVNDNTSVYAVAGPNLATVGAVAGTSPTITCQEYGSGNHHITVLTLTALALTLLDASSGGGIKVYDFPEGLIAPQPGSFMFVTGTTTSTLASTVNASAAFNVGVGSVVQANATLATTEQDIITVLTGGTLSATINVAGVAPGRAIKSTAATVLDGHTTAIDAYFNVAITTNTDIDADGTTLWTGVIVLDWLYLGDY